MQRAVPGGRDQEHAEGRAVLLDLHQVLTVGVHQGREDVRVLRGRILAVPQQDGLLPPGGAAHAMGVHLRHHAHGVGQRGHLQHYLRHRPLHHVQLHARRHGGG